MLCASHQDPAAGRTAPSVDLFSGRGHVPDLQRLVTDFFVRGMAAKHSQPALSVVLSALEI
eukprot:6051355-Prymnesium_polylepis.1